MRGTVSDWVSNPSRTNRVILGNRESEVIAKQTNEKYLHLVVHRCTWEYWVYHNDDVQFK